MVNFAKHYTTPLPKLCLMLLWPSSLGLGNPLTDTNSKLQIKSIIMEIIMLVPCTGVWRRFLAALLRWMLFDTHDDFRLIINYRTLTQTAMATQLLQRVWVVKNPFKVPSLWLVHSCHMISVLLDFIIFCNVSPHILSFDIYFQYHVQAICWWIQIRNTLYSKLCIFSDISLQRPSTRPPTSCTHHVTRHCCMLGKQCKSGLFVCRLCWSIVCYCVNRSWTYDMWHKYWCVDLV